MLHLLLALLLTQTGSPTATATPDSAKPTAAQAPAEHGLGEEVITGQAEIKVEDRKMYLSPSFDPFSPVDSMFVSQNYIFDPPLLRTIDSLTIPHQFIHSSYLRVPVERDLIYGDVIIFMPDFQEQVVSWELVVANSLGETVRRLSRKGRPPAMITWDGRMDNGEMISPGEIYSFTFSAYDAHGNQTRTPITPQRINGIVYKEQDEWVVSLAADLIFASGSAELLDQADRRLDEVANVIKKEFRKDLVVYVYTEQEKLSTARCAALEKELTSRIVLPAKALQVVPRFIPGLKPKFSKIEIRVR